MAGRPWKYKPLVDALVNDELYPTSKIIKHAEELGLFDHDLDEPEHRLSPEQKKAAKKKARSALANIAAKKLPKPDGEIEVFKPYRGFYPAWYGKTWKKAMGLNG